MLVQPAHGTTITGSHRILDLTATDVHLRAQLIVAVPVAGSLGRCQPRCCIDRPAGLRTLRQRFLMSSDDRSA